MVTKTVASRAAAATEAATHTLRGERQSAETVADITGKTVSFQFSVSAGGKPIEFKGSFTVNPARRDDPAPPKPVLPKSGNALPER
jgi:hypothetical protein